MISFSVLASCWASSVKRRRRSGSILAKTVVSDLPLVLRKGLLSGGRVEEGRVRCGGAISCPHGGKKLDRARSKMF